MTVGGSILTYCKTGQFIPTHTIGWTLWGNYVIWYSLEETFFEILGM